MTDDDYKQWLISKILSGQFDYTYGPGSPGATPSDMRQFTGARNNRLTTGDIALPPSDYALFTPAEREKYRIADTSFIKPGQPTPTGSVERYYGAEGATPSYVPLAMAAFGGPSPLATTPRLGSGQMSTWSDYFNALMPSKTEQFVSSFGKSLMNLGQNMQAGMQQAPTGIRQGPSPGAQVLAQLAANPTMFLQNPYLLSMMQGG